MDFQLSVDLIGECVFHRAGLVAGAGGCDVVECADERAVGCAIAGLVLNFLDKCCAARSQADGLIPSHNIDRLLCACIRRRCLLSRR